jgi:hypothetical protein
VIKTPVMTQTAPIKREGVNGSFKIKNDRIMALTGTKLINIPALAGPMALIPS